MLLPSTGVTAPGPPHAETGPAAGRYFRSKSSLAGGRSFLKLSSPMT